MNKLYPLKFEPIFKEKIWGGNKIKNLLGKNAPDNCGESWELSGVPGNVSVVRNGSLAGSSLQELIDLYKGELVGSRTFENYGNEFPLLIKFLDANEDLSIQVHPDDQLAKARHNCLGKTEMWYVLQADEGSKLVSGFNRLTNPREFVDSVKNGKLTEILNIEQVSDGDAFFIPAGRVHTIGKGLLIAEIQQTSDITYRIYDFDRVGIDGKKRELHIDESLEAIDYSQVENSKVVPTVNNGTNVPLVESKYFITNKISVSESYTKDYSDSSVFKILICASGEADIHCEETITNLKKGEVCLIPALFNETKIVPKVASVFLESYTP